MDKLIPAVVLTAFTATGFGADAHNRQHVPERLDKVRLIQPAAAGRNHILLCNVGNAVPADSWALASNYASSRLQLNVWTNFTDKIDVVALVLDPSMCQKAFGEKAKVCVFLVDDPKLPPFVSVPGRFCAANVHALREDRPALQTIRDRIAKTILKGMAYAAGSGSTLESACSLYHGSVTLQGLDKTGIMITPMAYFPMLEVLQAIGGPEMLTPAMEE